MRRSESPEWENLKRERPPGCCTICEEPLGPGRPDRVLCKDPHCLKAMKRIWAMSRNARLRAKDPERYCLYVRARGHATTRYRRRLRESNPDLYDERFRAPRRKT